MVHESLIWGAWLKGKTRIGGLLYRILRFYRLKLSVIISSLVSHDTETLQSCRRWMGPWSRGSTSGCARRSPCRWSYRWRHSGLWNQTSSPSTSCSCSSRFLALASTSPCLLCRSKPGRHHTPRSVCYLWCNRGIPSFQLSGIEPIYAPLCTGFLRFWKMPARQKFLLSRRCCRLSTSTLDQPQSYVASQMLAYHHHSPRVRLRSDEAICQFFQSNVCALNGSSRLCPFFSRPFGWPYLPRQRKALDQLWIVYSHLRLFWPSEEPLHQQELPHLDLQLTAHLLQLNHFRLRQLPWLLLQPGSTPHLL